MASRGDRFRGLGAGSPAGDPGESGATADLFEHFGVEMAPAAEPGVVNAIEAAGCRRCGWFLPLRRDDAPCPLCADPTPLLAPPEKPKS